MSDFKAKMYKIRFPLGFRPRPRWGAYSTPPDPIMAVFKGGGLFHRRGRGKREGRERAGRGEARIPR